MIHLYICTDRYEEVFLSSLKKSFFLSSLKKSFFLSSLKKGVRVNFDY